MDPINFIVNAMTDIDCELEKLNPKSVNLLRLRYKIKILIVSKANELIKLPPEQAKQAIKSIYQKCLTSAIYK